MVPFQLLNSARATGACIIQLVPRVLIVKALLSVVLVLAFSTHAANAKMSPTQMSCLLGDVLGQNRADDVRQTLTPMTPSWPDENRDAAIEQLEGLLQAPSFAGANVYLVGKLGEDLEAHLLVMRLARGEVAGALLRYEWAPDGFILTGMDFKSDINKLIEINFLQQPELLSCPS